MQDCLLQSMDDSAIHINSDIKPSKFKKASIALVERFVGLAI
jgi:hypothetical protein